MSLSTLSSEVHHVYLPLVATTEMIEEYINVTVYIHTQLAVE